MFFETCVPEPKRVPPFRSRNSAFHGTHSDGAPGTVAFRVVRWNTKRVNGTQQNRGGTGLTRNHCMRIKEIFAEFWVIFIAKEKIN